MGTRQEYEALAWRKAEQHFGKDTRGAFALHDLAEQESSFDPDVVEGRRVSSAGAEGIVQIIRRWHNVDPLDPSAALDYCAAALTQRWQATQNLRVAVASWNAGNGYVDGLTAEYGLLWEPQLWTETKEYLRIVMRRCLATVEPPRSPAGSLVPGILLPAAGMVVTQEAGMSEYARSGAYGRDTNGNPLPHTGIDVAGDASMPEGTLLGAVLPGTVNWHGWGAGGYGYVITVDVGDDLFLSYAHCAGPAVMVGNRVEVGTVLGYYGSTGRSVDDAGRRVPHTHMELRIGATGAWADPAPYLRESAPPSPPPPPPGVDWERRCRDLYDRWIMAEEEDGVRSKDDGIRAAVRLDALRAERAGL